VHLSFWDIWCRDLEYIRHGLCERPEVGTDRYIRNACDHTTGEEGENHGFIDSSTTINHHRQPLSIDTTEHENLRTTVVHRIFFTPVLFVDVFTATARCLRPTDTASVNRHLRSCD